MNIKKQSPQGELSVAKHTKGPWLYDETYGLIMAGEYEIAACHAGRGTDEKANARLIAAAPELLDALRWTIAALEYHGIDSSTGELDKAKQVLAKAEGSEEK